MPLELMRNGGWLNKKTIDSFVKYINFYLNILMVGLSYGLYYK